METKIHACSCVYQISNWQSTDEKNTWTSDWCKAAVAMYLAAIKGKSEGAKTVVEVCIERRRLWVGCYVKASHLRSEKSLLKIVQAWGTLCSISVLIKYETIEDANCDSEGVPQDFLQQSWRWNAKAEAFLAVSGQIRLIANVKSEHPVLNRRAFEARKKLVAEENQVLDWLWKAYIETTNEYD